LLVFCGLVFRLPAIIEEKSMNKLRYCKDYVFGAVAYLLTRHRMATNLTPLPVEEKLSPVIHRILGCNPGPFTLQGTNTYLIGKGPDRVLIDTGEPNIEKYTEELKKIVGDGSISCIICTHWHHDHVGGISNVFEKVIGKKVPVYKLKRPESGENAGTFEYIEDGHEIKTNGATLRLLATPGHTTDHIIVLFVEEQSVFSGDCILGEGTTVFEDLFTYMKSLELIKGLNPTKIYPGHGPVIDKPMEKITEYIEHRLKREREILAAITEMKTASGMDITNAVYKDIPLAVKMAALSNVKHHLSKLEKEGKIKKSGADTYEISI